MCVYIYVYIYIHIYIYIYVYIYIHTHTYIHLDIYPSPRIGLTRRRCSMKRADGGGGDQGKRGVEKPGEEKL